MNSPVRTSHSLTVPSSEDVITKRLLDCRQVTADWCLFGPGIKDVAVLDAIKLYSFKIIVVENDPLTFGLLLPLLLTT